MYVEPWNDRTCVVGLRAVPGSDLFEGNFYVALDVEAAAAIGLSQLVGDSRRVGGEQLCG